MITSTQHDQVVHPTPTILALPQPRTPVESTGVAPATPQSRRSPASERARERIARRQRVGPVEETARPGAESTTRQMGRQRVQAEAGPTVPPWLRHAGGLEMQGLLAYSRVALFR